MQTQSRVAQLGESSKFSQVFPTSEIPKIDSLTSSPNQEQPFQSELQQLEPSLTSSAFKLYSLLQDVALTIANRRGYQGVASGALRSLTFFCPKEVVARALNLDPRTIYRAAKLLNERDLLDNRAIKSTLKGEKRNAGTLWKVKLNPIGEGVPKFDVEELSHTWRDMDADAKQGRYAMLKKEQDDETEQSNPKEKISVQEEVSTQTATMSDINTSINRLINSNKVLEWALPTINNEINSLSISDIQDNQALTGVAELTTILDVEAAPFENFEARKQAVNIAAHSLSSVLLDSHSLNYWRSLLWQLLRCSDLEQGNYFYELYEQARTVQYDAKGETMKCPAAVLISRLKSKLWYEHVMRDVPRYPVAKNSRQAIKTKA